MGHAEHFLSRLDRVEGRDVELALSLYYHPELLRQTLALARIPEHEERVAISLDDPREGPFVIVTRNGEFVTCLARGMHLTNLPIVTRPILDLASDRLDQLRHVEKNWGLLARQLRSLLDGGDGVSREQFESVARWTPLFGGTLFKMLIESIGTLERWRRLSVCRRLRRHQEWMQIYRQHVHGLGHLYALCGENAESSAVLAHVAERSGVRFSYSLPGVLSDTSPVAHRALWASAQWGQLILGGLRDAVRDQENKLIACDALLSIGAIGHAHRRLRGRVVKWVQSAKHIRKQSKAVAASFHRAEDLDARALSRGRELCVDMARENQALPRWDRPNDVPEDVARAMLLRSDEQVIGNREYVDRSAEMLPWLGRAHASELYLPREILRALDKTSPASAIVLIDRARRHYGTRQVRAEERPSRNERCPCESGRKFKYCCLRAA